MSSTERAPEPTMEDILASIRRIITDDEAGQPTAEKPDRKAQGEDESIEGEADNQIIDDIARVLGGSGEAPASEDEEILDLTAELGGLEIVEEDVVEVVEIAEVAEVLELEDAAPLAPEPTEPVFVAMPEQDAGPQEAGSAAEMVPPETPVPLQIPEPVETAPEPVLSASEEAASALERAIAALKAGQVPTSTDAQAEPFQFEAAPQPDEMVAPDAPPPGELGAIPSDAIPMAVPMPEPAPEGEIHPDPEAQFVPDADANIEVELGTALPLEPLEDVTGTEAELVLTEVETTEIVIDEPQEFVSEEFVSEAPAFWPPASEQPSADQEPEPMPVFEPAAEAATEPVAAQINGADVHRGEDVARTLEDSIKDMLRPMLRQWLDDNMPRMIREELDADALRRHQD